MIREGGERRREREGGEVGLAGNVGRSRAARCFRIVTFSRIRQGIHFCSVNPDFE